MNEVAWKTTASGMVEGFPYHDSSIVGVKVVEREEVSLRLRQHSGAVGVLKLKRPTEICISQFYNGAVVADVFAWRVEQVPDLDPTIPDAGWNALLFSRYGDSGAKKYVPKIVLENPGSLLVVLSCSYGGTLAVVCAQMTYESNLN